MNDDISAFAEVNNRLLSGMMFHDEMYRFYLFLRLYSFAKDHRKHYKEESKSYQELNKYFITHRNRFIKDRKINADPYIPIDWFNKERQNLTPDDIRNATIFGMKVWIDWEKGTKELYTNAYNTLIKLGYAAEAEYILGLVKDVDDELCEAQGLELKLQGMNYDPIEIMGMN